MLVFRTLLVAFVGLVAADIDTVIADLNTITDQTTSLGNTINAFTGGGAAAAVPIVTASTTLKSAIDQGTKDAKAVSSVATADQIRVLQAAEKLLPQIYITLGNLVAKKDALGSDLLSTSTGIVSGIQTSSDQLSAALVGLATGDIATAAKALVSEIDAAFVAAESFVSLPATSAIPIPGATAPAGGVSSSATSTGSSLPTLDFYTGAAAPVATAMPYAAAAMAVAAMVF